MRRRFIESMRMGRPYTHSQDLRKVSYEYKMKRGMIGKQNERQSVLCNRTKSVDKGLMSKITPR